MFHHINGDSVAADPALSSMFRRITGDNGAAELFAFSLCVGIQPTTQASRQWELFRLPNVINMVQTTTKARPSKR